MKKFTINGVSPGTLLKDANNPAAGIVEPSSMVINKLKEDGKPVLVSFSRGKDSVAAMLALLANDIDVIPFHLYRVPDLQFENESLKYFEEFFGVEILNLPHPHFWEYLVKGVAQAPWQNSINEAAGLQSFSYAQLGASIRDALELDEDTWIIDGVRAADGPYRRLNLKQHGPWISNTVAREGEEYLVRKCHAVWDWKIADVRSVLEQNNVQLPVDYEMFGRTFDGLDYRFLAPIKERFPDDYATILEWFPAAELELMRYEWL